MNPDEPLAATERAADIEASTSLSEVSGAADYWKTSAFVVAH